MNEIAPRERTGRVVAFALLAWGGLVAGAAADGVLAKLPEETLFALAAIALAYAPSMYWLDASLREYARATVRPSMAAAAWALVAALGWIGSGPQDAEPLARWPIALAALFVAPLALAFSAAALERAAALRSPAAKRPGARPAAS